MRTTSNRTGRSNRGGGLPWRVFRLGVLLALCATCLQAQIEVTVRPRAALIETTGSVTVTAQVSGLVSGQRNGVNWSVNGVIASSATSLIYSPASSPEDTAIIVRASSLADASKFGALPVIRLLKSEVAQVSFPQAVAYHPSTGRIYVAAIVARPTSFDTNIFELLPSGGANLVATLASELIDKLVPYRSASGVPYLLGVSISTNSVQALNLGTRTARRVVGGLITPVSAGIHPGSGDLYIAEQTPRRVSVVTRGSLDAAIGGTSTAPFQALPFVIPDVSGIGFLADREVDRVFLLVTSTSGALYQVDVRDNTFQVVTTGLRRAQEILTLQSAQLDPSFIFVASPPTSSVDGQGSIVAIVPGGPGQLGGSYQMASGLDVPTDITFLPAGNPYSSTGRPIIVGINSSPTASRGRIIFWEIDPLSPAEFYSYAGRALPSIRLVSPAEGDVLQPGFPTEIRWSYSDASPLHGAYAPRAEAVQLSVSTDGGATFTPVETSQAPAGPVGQEYSLVWHVPVDLAETTIQLRVEAKDLEGGSLFAASSAGLAVLPRNNAVPRVLAARPNFAELGKEGGTAVTVSGLNFQAGATVGIEDIGFGAASEVSAARLAVNVSPGPEVPEGAKSLSVCVGAENCAVSETPFFVLSASSPSISAVEPGGAAAGGVVLLRGNNFSGIVTNNRVVFGNRPGTVLQATPSTMIVQIPYGLGLGRSSVQVETNGVASNSLDFFVVSHELEFPALINPDGIVNAASYAPGTTPLAPGSIASLFGVAVSPGNADAATIPLERELLDTTVLLGGLRAPLFVVRRNQINLQIPEELAGFTSAPAVVVSGGEAGNTVSVNLTTQSAGMFSADSSGGGPGAIINQDGTPNRSENPATNGSVISIYATGLGATEPAVPTASAAPSEEPLARSLRPPEVTIDGIRAEVTYAGRAPGFVGVDQINVAVPSGVSSDEATVPVVLVTPQGSSRQVSLFVPFVPPILHATFQTSLGTIICELYPQDAPIAVANFVELAEGRKEWTDPVTRQTTTRPLYDGTIFHRVIPEFVIQGGDPTGTGSGGPGYSFRDEFTPRLRFDQPGRLAMANLGPNTNGSQFFITEVATPTLNDHHTIFGQVIQGMDVVRAIARVPRNSNNRPLQPVTLQRLTIERIPGPGPARMGSR